MAMAPKMTLLQAMAMVPVLRKGVAKFGKQYAPGYTTMQLAEAVLLLSEQATDDGVTREEHTKLARQLAACTSREKGLRGRIAAAGGVVDFPPETVS